MGQLLERRHEFKGKVSSAKSFIHTLFKFGCNQFWSVSLSNPFTMDKNRHKEIFLATAGLNSEFSFSATN